MFSVTDLVKVRHCQLLVLKGYEGTSKLIDYWWEEGCSKGVMVRRGEKGVREQGRNMFL